MWAVLVHSSIPNVAHITLEVFSLIQWLPRGLVPQTYIRISCSWTYSSWKHKSLCVVTARPVSDSLLRKALFVAWETWGHALSKPSNCSTPVAVYNLGAVKKTLFSVTHTMATRNFMRWAKQNPVSPATLNPSPWFQLMGSSQEVLVAQSTSITVFFPYSRG